MTEAEYLAQRRLDEKKQEIEEKGFTPNPTKFQTQKQLIRDAVAAAREKAISYEDFKDILQDEYNILSKHNVGVTAICHRNGTSLYRSVLWEKAAKENVWKDSLFRTPRRICGTRKNPY